MAHSRRPWRLTIAQFLLLCVLAALLLGAAASAHRAARRERFADFCVSPEGTMVAAASPEGQLHAWDLRGRRPRRIETDIRTEQDWTWGDSLVFSGEDEIAFLRDGAYHGEATSRVERWNLLTGEKHAAIPLGGLPTQVLFSHDGSTFAAYDMQDSEIEIWEMGARQPRRTISLKSRPSELQLSGDGQALAVVGTFADEVRVYDTRSGKVTGTLPLPTSGTQLYFSTRGRRLAEVEMIYRSTNDYHWRVTIHDVVQQQTVSTIHVDQIPTEVVFDPSDQRLLCVHEGHESRIFDVATGRLLTTIEDGQRDGKSYSFTADGQRLAGLSSQQLAFWDMDSGRRTRVVWRNTSTWQAILFGTAFVLWGVAWGWVARRRRPDPLSAVAGRDPELAMPQEPPPADVGKPKPPRLGRSLLILIALMAFVMTLLTMSSSGSLWQRVGIVMAGTLGLVAVALAIGAVYVVCRELLSRGYEAQLSRAVQAAGRQGRLLRLGRFTVWFAGPSDLLATLEEELAATEERLRQMLGAVTWERPAVILVFDVHEQFQRYVGRPLRLGGVYLRWFRPQLVISESFCEESLTPPARILRSLLGYHLLLESQGFWLPPWIQAVVNAGLLEELAGAHGQRTAHRRLQLALRADQLPVARFLRWNRREMGRAVMQSDPAEATRQSLMITDMARSLAAYLLGQDAGERRERFQRLVLELGRRDAPEDAFRRHFGHGYDELVQAWKLWLLEQPTESLELPEGWTHRQMVENILPVLRDPAAATVESRARRIAALGAAGYLASAEALIERLEAAEEPRRAEVVAALERIAGRSLGDDPAGWRAWWVGQDEAARVLPPLLLDEPPRAVPLDETSPAVPPAAVPPIVAASPSTSAQEPEPAATGLPRWVAPAGLRQTWTLMFMGGITAITLAVLLLFQSQLWWMPTIYWSILVGIVAISRSVARSSRGLRLTAGLQIANLLSCDVINLVLGIVELVLLRDQAVRHYLRFEQADGVSGSEKEPPPQQKLGPARE